MFQFFDIKGIAGRLFNWNTTFSSNFPRLSIKRFPSLSMALLVDCMPTSKPEHVTLESVTLCSEPCKSWGSNQRVPWPMRMVKPLMRRFFLIGPKKLQVSSVH